ncbi:MAG: hypothetical protein IJT50_16660 [Lentisphaeria bacterium]|nr:hypothetical protein [Lentisphaeria bacterium]
MCNMAAYAGNRAAAPILFRMLQSQEALGGGHYNGIATIHEGRIHLIKVVGSTSELLRRYPEVLQLPGTVGIAHSRTPGIDSDAWAQPFFSHDEKVIYCANGAAGRFKGKTDYNTPYMQDKAEGFAYRTAIAEPADSYPVMKDGACVHSSEVVANTIRRVMGENGPLRKALGAAVSVLKSELAALALAVNEPDTVSALRINQPLMWGRDPDGFYLATSAFALENERLQWINPVPACSVMTMGRKKIEFEALSTYLPLMAPCDPVTEIRRTLEAMLDTGEDFCVNDFCVAAAKCWPPEVLAPANMTVYEFLREKVHCGAIESFVVDTKGSGAGLTAPQRRFRKVRA